MSTDDPTSDLARILYDALKAEDPRVAPLFGHDTDILRPVLSTVLGELQAELDKLIRWHKEDGEQAAKMRATIERLRAERTELIRQRDQISMDTIKALPAPADRAAVLREAIAKVRAVPVQCTALTGPTWYGQGWEDAIKEVEDIAERLADETQQPTAAVTCGHCEHPADWHDEYEGCVGPNGIGDVGSDDCTCTRTPGQANPAQQSDANDSVTLAPIATEEATS